MQNLITSAFFALIMSVVLCECSGIPELTNFNKDARSFYNGSIDEIDFGPLAARDKCIITSIVNNELDSLNNSRSVIFDSRFIGRNYYSEYLQLDLNFIYDIQHERFYFFAIPQLTTFFYNFQQLYIQRDDGRKTLRDSISLIDINSSLASDFFNEWFQSSNLAIDQPNRSMNEAQHILRYCLISLEKNRISLSEFAQILREKVQNDQLSGNTYRDLLQVIEPDITREVVCYSLPSVGYFLCELILLNGEIKCNCKVLPNKTIEIGGYMRKDTDMYPLCE